MQLVIIGSGLAGYMLAKEYRKYNMNTPLTIITAAAGDFYSKPLLSTALTQNRTPETLITTSVAEMRQQLQADIITFATVQQINPGQREIIYRDSDNQLKTMNYAKLVLACGGKNCRAQLIGNAVHEILSINNLEDYAGFRLLLKDKKRIAIIGAGLVGCEFANDLLNVGYQVSVISPENYPLTQLIPPEIGSKVKNAFSEKGLHWHLGEFATAVNKKNDEYHITLADGHSVISDLVISAVGLRPDCDLAIDAGLKVNHGILVDRFLQTTNPDIYALGDCAEVIGTVKMYVAPLLQCARALATVLAGDPQAVVYPIMPIVIKTPICPLASVPPPENILGQWRIEGGEGLDAKALFFDQQGQLRGYVLMGHFVRDRMKLAKELAIVF